MGQVIKTTALQESSHVMHTTVQVSRAELHEGHLLLINRDNPVNQPVQMDKLLPLSSNLAMRELQDGMLLEKTCLRQLAALLEAVQAMDEIIVVSGYRTKEEQQEIYETSLIENGADYTACYVALPNQSEHQTGLAVDVGQYSRDVDFIAPSFPNEGVCQSFRQLSAEYGFIQRYKEGKESITNISCEPWHFRYVGYPHASLMEKYGFCLEEYIEFLKSFTFSGERLTFEHGSLQVELYYVSAEEGPTTTVPILKCELYHISGNNRDGFIITAFHGKG